MTKDEIITKCLKLKQQKKGITRFLEDAGFTNNEIYEIKSQLGEKKQAKRTVCNVSVRKEDESNWGSSLKYKEKYVYNKEDDKYVFYLKSANGNIVLPGSTVRNIVENYSNWNGKGHSVNDICRNHKIPRNYFNELKECLGITHDSEPVTREELLDNDVDSIVEDILQKKKFELFQAFQKKSWKDTEESATKWNRFMEGVYNPFTEFLNNWTPPSYNPVKYMGSGKGKPVGKKAMLVGLSDVHFGSKSSTDESYRSKGYSTQEAVECIARYSEDIRKVVEERNYNFDSCVVASLGDILHTTGSGFTTKGTMLVHDCVKEEQFNFAFNSIVEFISKMLTLFPKVYVKSVKGNHNDFGDYVLFKALAAYYRTEKRIEFEVFQTDHGLFKVNNCLFIISHGYSAEYKGRIPTTAKARESYIANLFLSKPETLIDIKQKVLLTADQHHLEMREYAEFEHYMLSTTVRGDKHSEAMGLNNIARQSSFIVDDYGIKEIIYSYGRK